jgi:hypothetical protein
MALLARYIISITLAVLGKATEGILISHTLYISRERKGLHTALTGVWILGLIFINYIPKEIWAKERMGGAGWNG